MTHTSEASEASQASHALQDSGRAVLVRRGLRLEYATLVWNVVGVVVVGVAGLLARSVALAGFGLDSLIEIFASVVVVWELTGSASEERTRRALRMIGTAFFALAIYLVVQGIYVLLAEAHPRTSPAGMVWTALTCVVMVGLAAGKGRTGRALGNRVLTTESRVTLVDACLAGAVLVGLVLRAALGWWWADPLAGFVIVFYGVKEGRAAWRGEA
jgi:divalent metal cation (Fe/Co/Zn/Cd) transporter